MKQILLIIMGIGTFIHADFTRDTNGIITDNKTTLQWQDDYSDNTNSIPHLALGDAINYCEILTLGGQSDWRLPNVNELVSLVDDTHYNPAIDDSVFQNTRSGQYWSSTTTINYSGDGWKVDFYHGTFYRGSGKSVPYSVRCVRAGK